MWRIIEANVLSGNFLKGFYCLRLYILLIAKMETNKLLFSLADLPNTGTKGGSVQSVPSGSRAYIPSLSSPPQSAANTGSSLKVLAATESADSSNESPA